jgi:hypothetical protein
MKKILIYLLPLILTLSGCAGFNEDANSNSDDSAVNTKVISFNPSVSTRTAMEGGFKSGDMIGVYMIARTNSGVAASFTSTAKYLISNAAYTCGSSGEWSFPSRYYWADGETVYDVYAYYPYTSISNNTTANAFPISLSVDQSTQTALRRSDFLYCGVNQVSYESNNTSGIPLIMKHKLCKVNVTFSVGSIDLTKVTVTVRNVDNKGSINLSTGAVSTTETTTTITPLFSAADKKMECILMPQTIRAATDFIHMTYKDSSNKDVDLAFTLNDNLSLESGKEYNFTFQYTASNVIKSSLTIKDLNP